MGIGSLVMLCQMTTYVLCCIFAFFVFVPMAVNKNSDFNGNCLLFATGEKFGTDQIDITSWGAPGSCNFAITIGVLVALVAIFQIVRLSFHVYYETDSSFIGAFGTFILNVIMTIMLFASAVNVTNGYSAWCDIINQVADCSLAGFEKQHWTLLLRVYGIQPENYAIELGMVQFGLWSELLMWLVICMCSVIKLVKYNQRESIIRSLGRERERLIGRYEQPEY